MIASHIQRPRRSLQNFHARIQKPCCVRLSQHKNRTDLMPLRYAREPRKRCGMAKPATALPGKKNRLHGVACFTVCVDSADRNIGYNH